MLRTLVIALTMFAGSSSAQAQSTLTTKWQDGEKRTYVIDDNYTSRSTVGQQTFELRQSLTLDTTWEVDATSPDGGVKLNVSIDRVRYTADGKGAAAIIQNLNFDSNAETEPKSKPEQGVTKALKNYVGPVGVVAIDGLGSVTEFSISDTLSEKLKDTGVRELAGFFGDLFTPNGLRHRLTNWLVAFPAGPLPDSKTWSQELPSRAGATIVAIRNYELVGSTRIDAGTFLQINFTPQFKASDDTKLKIADQKGNGVVHLDKDTHHIRDFVLRHQGRITSFSDQTFDIVYSAKLRSIPREGEQ
ncbi:hypothetical protein SH139x_004804 [Planctomycetaceae bacterium SH139]